ncbi:MAG: histidine ammonia-lyase [Pseudomonadota bacterium]
MKNKLYIDGKSLTLKSIDDFLRGDLTVDISSEVAGKINATRSFVDKKVASDHPIYGLNTGFGRLAKKRISIEKLDELQENLIISHAVGVGRPLSEEISRLMLLLRTNVLAHSFSGIRLETLNLLIELINKNITPVIPSQGSVGASGDLAPLAHLALTLIGKGEVYHLGKIVPSADALSKEGLKPIRLKAKEGLSLINGTQGMTAIGVLAILNAIQLIKVSDIAAASSLEGDMGSLAPFDKRIHELRPHPGQIITAENIRKLTSGSKNLDSHKNCKRVQDPYSLRCVPQVHGATKDLFAYSKGVIERELVSCTDNPLVFVDDDEILSGGNFHGEPVAFAMDTLCIALSELGSISERRIALLNAPLEGEIPAMFLIEDAGLSSGMMIPHVVAASLVSENKTLSNPSSVDSIPTSADQEDHVSMGMHSARKALKVTENLKQILAIELLAAAQAIDLNPKRNNLGSGTNEAYKKIRKYVSFAKVDREFRFDIAKIAGLIENNEIVKVVEERVGELKTH